MTRANRPVLVPSVTSGRGKDKEYATNYSHLFALKRITAFTILANGSPFPKSARKSGKSSSCHIFASIPCQQASSVPSVASGGGKDKEYATNYSHIFALKRIRAFTSHAKGSPISEVSSVITSPKVWLHPIQLLLPFPLTVGTI
jgi:hypothetical protein